MEQPILNLLHKLSVSSLAADVATESWLPLSTPQLARVCSALLLLLLLFAVVLLMLAVVAALLVVLVVELPLWSLLLLVLLLQFPLLSFSNRSRRARS